MKVYVITKGTYSNYHICAVATDKEKAEKLAKIYTDRDDDAGVEEYDTEAEVDLLAGRIPYEVEFDPCGEVRRAYPNAECRGGFKPRITEVFYRGNITKIYVCLFASSEEEAIKIAAEKRAQFLAEREGLV